MPNSGSERPPPWIWDDEAVSLRVLARVDDAPFADVWWDVAACIRLVGRLTNNPPPMRERWALLADALGAVSDLARRLPPPIPAPYTGPPWRDALSDLREYGPGVVTLERIAAALCDDLALPWSCPDRLSGLVDDLTGALRVYVQEYARLMPTPDPGSACAMSGRQQLPACYPTDGRRVLLRRAGHLLMRGPQ